jgi:hypothetical protein
MQRFQVRRIVQERFKFFRLHICPIKQEKVLLWNAEIVEPLYAQKCKTWNLKDRPFFWMKPVTCDVNTNLGKSVILQTSKKAMKITVDVMVMLLQILFIVQLHKQRPGESMLC